MTQEEQSVADDMMRAEIAYLGAQTARSQQRMRWQIPLYLISFIGALVTMATFQGS